LLTGVNLVRLAPLPNKKRGNGVNYRFPLLFLMREKYYQLKGLNLMVTSKMLISKDQTGKEMHRLINRYCGDLDHVKVFRRGISVPFSSLPLNEAYDFVRKIPYRKDNKPVEVVARPAEIIRQRDKGMDCKKKAIVLTSYLRCRGLPYRLVATSRLPTKRIHHVFPQMGFAGRWLNFDATYPHYAPFEQKRITKMEVLQ
jgi:hypothetical protein